VVKKVIEEILKQFLQGIKCYCNENKEFECVGEAIFKAKKIWVKEVVFKVLATLFKCEDNIDILYLKPKLLIVNKDGDAEAWL
jgi:hypothetical protein